MPRCDRNVVEEAEPHAVRSRCMMTRRPDQAQGVRCPPAHHTVDSSGRGARGKQSNVVRCSAYGGVRVDLTTASRRQVSDPSNLIWRMDSRYLSKIRPSDFAALTALGKPRGLEAGS